MSHALNIAAANVNAPRIDDSTPRSLTSLAGMGRTQLREAALACGVEERKAKMRANQLFGWIYHYGSTSFDEMTNIDKETRARLAAHYTLDRPKILERQVSTDGTRKYLIELAPGVECETVFIPDVARSGALCVSSQVGCTLNCTFCHTGTQALVRNLTAAEIVAQVMIARDDLAEWPSSNDDRKVTNIVFMGMGEPLYNLDHVSDSIDTISDPEGMAIGRRRITVSTSGVVPKISELGTRTNTMLAISLHATNDALRDELVPLNKKYPLKMLMDAIRAYPGLNNSRRITFEYVMLKGVNDSLAEARALVKLLKGVPAKINLIPFNPWPNSPYECSDWPQIVAFADLVNKAGYASPIRTPRGRDIFAACGQLRSESKKVKASELKKQRLEQQAAAGE
ncbi:23S rRNA (adenine(2503)-C(2))-methyltransferase RlmN [Maricaulis salignorans]|uniref:Dual-specificity RNA methyltransferase RlmN n=1 Tax=Maricaulis salignorans TaxID=144026 RepID=A0A1G9SWV1_9PROT|nr:23S rRNA (adenine(2503)-C(2))-methyltransferase RlmN [Maricaulis salignorans]SDM39325.1 23S rRNA m(2)A-2503 methyltransferase [Maricaulis salignorans]